MQRLSLQSPPSTLFPLSPLFSSPLRVQSLSHNRNRSLISSLNCSYSGRPTVPPLHSIVTEGTVETSENELGFIEVGHIYGIHGLAGELRVRPTTGFPELRFSKPGRRWLKERVYGKEAIREVELVKGREHPGKKCWIVSFEGIDSAEEAMELIGSTLLVSETDRPVLEEGEFYTRDLVGMSVILKETSQPVGTVINVFNTGAHDLLEVVLNSADKTIDGTASSKSEAGVSGPLVLVPFVNEIVPGIDMSKRELQITPPKGLLELNVHSDQRSKKERRQLEWKQRKKAARRLITAKKKLVEMEQKHVFHGLRFGEKPQKSLLADNIVGINFPLFKQAVGGIEMFSSRVWQAQKGESWENRAGFGFTNITSGNAVKLFENSLKVSMRWLLPFGPEEMHDAARRVYDFSKPTSGNTAKGYNSRVSTTMLALDDLEDEEKHDAAKELQQKGLHTISEGKVATILIIDDKTNQGKGSDLDNPGCIQNSSNISCLQALFCNDQQFVKIVDDQVSMPLIIVSPADETQSLQKLFLDHDYFGLDAEKVWLLEEEELPVVSSSQEDEYKILMKSPWEILQSPVGSGGIYSLISSHGIIESLSEMGVDYVQVCSLGHRPVLGCQLFVGYVHSRDADIGVLLHNERDIEEDFNMIFSMRFLKKMTKQISELQFHAIPKQNPHTTLVDKEWVDIVPSSPNSYEMHLSIYSSLNLCSGDKICVIEVID